MTFAAPPGPLCATRVLPIDDDPLGLFTAFIPGPMLSLANRPCANLSQSIAGGLLAWLLSPSAEAIALLKQIETLRLKPYDDQTGREVSSWVEGATIGYGHLIGKADWERYRSGITEADAEALFENDLAPFVEGVRTAIDATLQQYEFDALVILTFNIGLTNFRNSTVVQMINRPADEHAYLTLESAWKAWNKSQGKINTGLINRRNAEWEIYTNAAYSIW